MEGEGWPPEPRLYPSATIMILDAGPVPTRTQAINNMPTRAKADSAFAQLSRARRIRAHSVKVPSSSAANPERQQSNWVSHDRCIQYPCRSMSVVTPTATIIVRHSARRRWSRRTFRALIRTECSEREGNVISDTLGSLVEKNLSDVFGQRDSTRRAAAIAELYTADCTFFEVCIGADVHCLEC